MADIFGALTLPIPVPTNPGIEEAQQAVSDPGLDHLAAFTRAILNAHGGDAWGVKGVGPQEPFVRVVMKCDPAIGEFSAALLPALYIWRGAAQYVQLADDYGVDETPIEFLYVMPTTQQGRMQARSPIVNGFGKILSRGFRRQRDPAWVLAGDTDPDAAVLGSSLTVKTGFSKMLLTTAAEPTTLSVQTSGRTATMVYPAIRALLAVTEQLCEDPSAAAGAVPAQLDLKTTTEDGPDVPPARLTGHTIIDFPFAANVDANSSVAAELTVTP